MAFKIRKLPQKKKKENEISDEKLSVNRMERRDKDGPVSVNLALEEERAERNLSSGKTVSVADNELMKNVDKSSLDKEFKQKKVEQIVSENQDYNLNESDEESVNKTNPNNFQLDEKELEEDRRQTILKGKQLPVAKELRDTEKDSIPIEEDDLGLPEESYLISRKVTKKDLMLQNETQEKQFLGANVRKLRDFVSIFDKGLSSKASPKIDMNYQISQNPILRKELVAQQLLRNYKSKNGFEHRNTKAIFKELNLLEDEEFKDSIDLNEAHQNESLIAKLISKLPQV